MPSEFGHHVRFYLVPCILEEANVFFFDISYPWLDTGIKCTDENLVRLLRFAEVFIYFCWFAWARYGRRRDWKTRW